MKPTRPFRPLAPVNVTFSCEGCGDFHVVRTVSRERARAGARELGWRYTEREGWLCLDCWAPRERRHCGEG